MTSTTPSSNHSPAFTEPATSVAQSRQVADRLSSPESPTSEKKISNSVSRNNEHYHRVDGSHGLSATVDQDTPYTESSERVSKNQPLGIELSGREAWLKFHASDLILRLQEWATDLDAREATLNAAYARQDLRERQFRLHQQEIEAELLRHRLAADDLRDRMNAHARRLAFQTI